MQPTQSPSSPSVDNTVYAKIPVILSLVEEAAVSLFIDARRATESSTDTNVMVVI